MFTRVPDASKVALVALCRFMTKENMDLIDCQVTTSHLLWMGAREIPRRRFLRQLKASVSRQGVRGKWAVSLDKSL
jgi:leucyl/phenylalanyl-tRNA--protein transferase